MERRAAPTRTCVQCRSTKDKRELLRIVRTPAGEVVYDPTGKANGRGAYVCSDEGCLTGAFEKGGLRRALEVDVPITLAADLRRIVSRGTFDGAE